MWKTGSGKTRLHASLGRASKLPSFFALASPPALGGNPDLKPERTVGGEAGVEQALLGGRLELGAAAFLHEYRDLVDFDFDLFTHVNRAKVRTRGAELTLRWQPHATLVVAGEATFVDADDLSGEPLLYEPRWLGSGGVTWRAERAAEPAARGAGAFRATSTGSSRCPTATPSTATASSASPARGASAAASPCGRASTT